MERTVPSTATEEIDLYLRTIYSLLRSTTEIQIRTLEEVHAGTNSSLHPEARSQAPDISAFIYALTRLPACMPDVHSVLLGQSEGVFREHGYANIESWQPVTARARRRRCYFDGKSSLACFIASRSDIDDVVPNLTAYQLEWNKFHTLLQRCPPALLRRVDEDTACFAELADYAAMSVEDLRRLQSVVGDGFENMLKRMAQKRCNFHLRLLEGSLTEYARATRMWMDNIMRSCPDLATRPIYFVSSNTHSLANLVTGFALQVEDELAAYINNQAGGDLAEEWQNIQASNDHGSRSNFLYYVLKKYQSTPEGEGLIERQLQWEREHGITRIPSGHTFDIDAQVIDLAQLDTRNLDPRLADGGLAFLKRSDAMILNIDYPLGLAAYNVLAKVVEYVDSVLGVYVMGKAASLNGVMGDVMIPNVVHDEHSTNTYLFQNAFSAADVAPYLVYGTVLDNQKAVSVLGTFLQNARIMDIFYREGYTDFEMEAGPYLSAIYEMVRPKRHPYNEVITLYNAPLDLGVLHYVSDTPLSKGKNLGAGTMSYFGMDSTYACSLAIARRIVFNEKKRIGK